MEPSHNHSVGGPTTLPSKHCRFSASQLSSLQSSGRHCPFTELCHHAPNISSDVFGRAGRAQMPSGSPLVPLLNKVRIALDYILSVFHCAALSLGRGMASMVVAQMHLWLNLSDVRDRERAVYLDELVLASRSMPPRPSLS
ncbi:uncharacterized protein AKAME5_001307400 [Lates japonicus]|uniref:Uncharacterized protein n=1 Tax=Lates japonicus TaxID=270547 RepID=A0AAD3MXY7_LATJO|nr:uncharacterized protein AKAME5_001307400 [Lates japonicus]